MTAAWLDTGGPLIVLPRFMARTWRGVEGDDYAAACAVDGYVGVLRRAHGDIVVLGDEPMRSTVVEDLGEGVIVRWLAAPGEGELLETVRKSRLEAVTPAEVVPVRFVAEPYLVMSAASSGVPGPSERLSIRIPARASHATAHVVGGPAVKAVVIRFIT